MNKILATIGMAACLITAAGCGKTPEWALCDSATCEESDFTMSSDATGTDASDVIEICDGNDNDGDGLVDEGCSDVIEICDGNDNDGDGLVDEGCSDVIEICDGNDNDGDGLVDEGCSDVIEICDGNDNDGDGLVDEECVEAPHPTSALPNPPADNQRLPAP